MEQEVGRGLRVNSWEETTEFSQLPPPGLCRVLKISRSFNEDH